MFGYSVFCSVECSGGGDGIILGFGGFCWNWFLVRVDVSGFRGFLGGVRRISKVFRDSLILFKVSFINCWLSFWGVTVVFGFRCRYLYSV